MFKNKVHGLCVLLNIILNVGFLSVYISCRTSQQLLLLQLS